MQYQRHDGSAREGWRDDSVVRPPSPNDWGSANASIAYGGPNNLMGATLTPADVDSPTFGMGLRVGYGQTAGNGTACVDQMPIRQRLAQARPA